MKYLLSLFITFALITAFPVIGYVCMAYVALCAVFYVRKRMRVVSHANTLTPITKD